MIFDVNAWCYAYVCKICPLGNYSAKSNECVEDELIESNQRSFKIQTSIWWTGSWSPFHILITFAHCLSKARSSLNPFWYYEWALHQIISDHKAIKTLVKPLKQILTASRLSTLPTQWKTHTLQLSPIPKNTLTPGTHNSWTSPSLDKVPIAQFQLSGQVGIIWGCISLILLAWKDIILLQVNVIAIGFLKERERESVWLIPGTCEGL